MKSYNSKTILIVEDQAADVIGLCGLTANLGYQITWAFDGEQALTEMERQFHKLVVLDWQLPTVGGAEFLNRLNQRYEDYNGKPVQVVIHSGLDLSHEDMSDSNVVRIVDIWKKPMSPSHMLKRMKRIAEITRRTL